MPHQQHGKTPTPEAHTSAHPTPRKTYKRLPRIAGRPLQRIREQHFARFPLCVMCEAAGRVTLATELDHIIPLEHGGPDVESNRQGLCKHCHLLKTAKDRNQTLRPTIGADGYPIKEVK